MGEVMICLVVSCFLWSGELESPYLLLSHHVIPLASHTIIILISIYLSIFCHTVCDRPSLCHLIPWHCRCVNHARALHISISMSTSIHRYLSIYIYL